MLGLTQTCIDMKSQALTYLNSPSAALQVFTLLQPGGTPGAYVPSTRDIRIYQRAPEDMAYSIMHEGGGHGWFTGQMSWGLVASHPYIWSALDTCWEE